MSSTEPVVLIPRPRDGVSSADTAAIMLAAALLGFPFPWLTQAWVFYLAAAIWWKARREVGP